MAKNHGIRPRFLVCRHPARQRIRRLGRYTCAFLTGLLSADARPEAIA